MGRNNLVGSWGESVAAEYLRKKHYKLIATNYRCRYGEIDLIAEEDGNILFVEVKTRSADAVAAPSASVSDAKQLRLLRAASQWLEEHPSSLQPRFDVAEVILAPDTGDLVSVSWLKDAFGLEGRSL